MKKAYFCFLMISVLLLTACARDISNPSPTAIQATVITTESLPPEHTTVPTEPAVPFDWSQLKTVRFLFASGAGGWGTILYINPDGSFFGNYHDSEASTGPGYPNGSVAYCDFTGQFDTPVAIDGHSYSLKLKEIQYSHPLGTEEIRMASCTVMFPPMVYLTQRNFFCSSPVLLSQPCPNISRTGSAMIWKEQQCSPSTVFTM